MPTVEQFSATCTCQVRSFGPALWLPHTYLHANTPFQTPHRQQARHSRSALSKHSAMLAEAIHSLVDVANQFLLRVGVRKAEKVRPRVGSGLDLSGAAAWLAAYVVSRGSCWRAGTRRMWEAKSEYMWLSSVGCGSCFAGAHTYTVPGRFQSPDAILTGPTCWPFRHPSLALQLSPPAKHASPVFAPLTCPPHSLSRNPSLFLCPLPGPSKLTAPGPHQGSPLWILQGSICVAPHIRRGHILLRGRHQLHPRGAGAVRGARGRAALLELCG